VKILRRKLDDMERSYDVLLDEVKQMRIRVEGKDSHGSQAAAQADSDKTHDEKIQVTRSAKICVEPLQNMGGSASQCKSLQYKNRKTVNQK